MKNVFLRLHLPHFFLFLLPGCCLFLYFLETESLAQPWSLPIRIDWLASEARDLPVSTSTVRGLPESATKPDFFPGPGVKTEWQTALTELSPGPNPLFSKCIVSLLLFCTLLPKALDGIWSPVGKSACFSHCRSFSIASVQGFRFQGLSCPSGSQYSPTALPVCQVSPFLVILLSYYSAMVWIWFVPHISWMFFLHLVILELSSRK